MGALGSLSQPPYHGPFHSHLKKVPRSTSRHLRPLFGVTACTTDGNAHGLHAQRFGRTLLRHEGRHGAKFSVRRNAPLHILLVQRRRNRHDQWRSSWLLQAEGGGCCTSIWGGGDHLDRAGTTGLGPYEMIEQLLDAGLTPGENYTLSMYVALTDEGASDWVGDYQLTLGVARNEVRYQSQDGFASCEEEYGKYQNGLSQELFIVGRVPLTLTAYPPSGGWQRISVGFRAPDGPGSWDWLFMDVTSTNTDWTSANCEGDYLFIDDVSLSRSEFCNSVCRPELGPITYWRYVNNVQTYGVPPTGVTVGGSAGQSFYIYVENAIGIDLSVRNSLGHEIYHRRVC